MWHKKEIFGKRREKKKTKLCTGQHLRTFKNVRRRYAAYNVERSFEALNALEDDNTKQNPTRHKKRKEGRISGRDDSSSTLTRKEKCGYPERGRFRLRAKNERKNETIEDDRA